MKITNENIKDINFFAGNTNTVGYCQRLLEVLLVDLAALNVLLIANHEEYRLLYIDYENEHTEYSPERTDPCPDYYGTFTLRFENDPSEKIGPNMELDDLDTMICGLYNFVEFQHK